MGTTKSKRAGAAETDEFDKYRRAARIVWVNPETTRIRVDDGPMMVIRDYPGQSGAWVGAWIFVSDADVEDLAVGALTDG